MFKKLHLQLTIFCTLVTGAILIAMTGVCLFILHADASRQSFLSFEKNVASAVSYLGNQPIISHQWLLELKKNYHFLVSISDGDTPLFFNSLNYSEKIQELFQKAKEQALLEYQISSLSQQKNRKVTETAAFPLKDGQGYYAAVSVIPKEQNALYVITLYSLQEEKATRMRQNLLFSSAALTAILCLAVFSWFFTRRILLPVEENRRRQTEFVAAASHELRSPLTVILSSLAAMQGAPQEKQRQFAVNIQEEGRRMNRLVSDMLALANADNGSWSFCPSEEEPDTFLLEMYERYLPRAREKKIRLDIHLPEVAVLPQRWDTDRMTQVLEILLDNALTYTPAGGCIRLILSQKQEKTEIRVADNGPGIPDDEKEIIFQRFYRMDSSHHDKNHFGLGLCIAKEILRLHKGRIHVEDTPGGGACFVILLPSSHKHH
ncbi:MAG: HAMP domain-containing histidine kinase [Lachnospiraceae bacterium]|nr:HAMP domain-containing histidine kinase [Lachnospiraceae bacterium]